MKKIRRILKYIVLIPVRILYLPRIYRRLVALEEKGQEWGRQLQTVEDNIRSLNSNSEEHTRLANEARHECYIAETMVKALAANLRDFAQTAEEIKAKLEVLENMKDLSQKNQDQVKIYESGFDAAIRDLTRDVNRLKEILVTKEEVKNVRNNK